MSLDPAGSQGTTNSTSDGLWARYRCPVCGHRDRISLGHSEHAGFPCTHCSAVLELRGKAGDGESVEVAVRRGGSPH